MKHVVPQWNWICMPFRASSDQPPQASAREPSEKGRVEGEVYRRGLRRTSPPDGRHCNPARRPALRAQASRGLSPPASRRTPAAACQPTTRRAQSSCTCHVSMRLGAAHSLHSTPSAGSTWLGRGAPTAGSAQGGGGQSAGVRGCCGGFAHGVVDGEVGCAVVRGHVHGARLEGGGLDPIVVVLRTLSAEARP